MRRVLSIDWDYFTGDQQFCDVCKVCRWSCWSQHCHPKTPQTRCRNDKLRDGPQFSFTSVKKTVKGWSKKIKGAPLIVADCHGSIYRYLEKGDTVYNYDHHEDWDLGGNFTTCANWARRAEQNKSITYRWISKWNTPARLGKTLMDLVFVCQSTPYTAPKLDDYFRRMLRLLSRATGTDLKFVGLGAREMRGAYRRFLAEEQP